MTFVLALLFGGLIGLSLGSLGGGGSILVVPALIYGLSLSPKEAVPPALVIVGLTSAYAAMLHWRRGSVRIYTVLMFSLTGCVGAYQGAGASRAVSDGVLLICLGAVMAAAGALMLRSARHEKIVPEPQKAGRTRLPVFTLVAGYVVGFLTGFLGIGGGFLIVPALTLVARVPVKQAIGTSLVVISLNCAGGLMAHRVSGIDWSLVGLFLIASLTASIFATRLAHRASSVLIKQLFAGFILLIGGLTLAGNLIAPSVGP